MGEAIITRRGGAGKELTLTPSITLVSAGTTSVTFTITNNDELTATVFYQIGVTPPTQNTVVLNAGATSASLTLSGLTATTNYILYAAALADGKDLSEVALLSFSTTAPFAATGGTSVFDSGAFRVHQFTSSGNFVVTSGSNDVEYLVIGGGGSGGCGGGQNGTSGGGGAGGYRTGTLTRGAGTYVVTVGAGNNNSAFDTITSLAGGVGGCGARNSASGGASGGSGGGGSRADGDTGTPNSGAPGAGTAGQGNGGGNSAGGFDYRGGGGGGASAGGGTSNGGAGASSSITGTAVTRAGGGGGAATNNNVGIGGAGGGGNGARYNNFGAGSGAANTGSGGGGGSWSVGAGGGGSGIVIIRYVRQ